MQIHLLDQLESVKSEDPFTADATDDSPNAIIIAGRAFRGALFGIGVRAATMQCKMGSTRASRVLFRALAEQKEGVQQFTLK